MAMTWTFTCECGEAFTSPDDQHLVLAVAGHVAQAHPAVGTAPPAADVLSMAEVSQDAGD